MHRALVCQIEAIAKTCVSFCEDWDYSDGDITIIRNSLRNAADSLDRHLAHRRNIRISRPGRHSEETE